MDKHFIKNFLKGSLFTSFGQFSTIVFHFLSIMIMTRYVPKNELGLYLLIIVVSILFQILSSLGLDLTLVKFVSSNGKDKKTTDVFIPILLLRTLQLVLVSSVFYLLSDSILPLFDERIKRFVFYIIIIFSLGSFRDLFFYLLQGLNLFKKYAIAQVLSAATKFLLILLFQKVNNLTVETLLFIDISSYSLTIMVQVIFTPFSEIRHFELNRETLRLIFYFGIPLYFNNILAVINDRVNTFIVAAFMNTASIANFEIAKKIPEAFARMFQSFMVVYFPNLSDLFSQKKNIDAQKLMNNSLSFFSVGILSLVTVAFLFQVEIMNLVFSEEYLTAALAFALLMLNLYLRTISNIMGYSLVSAGYSSAPVKINSVTSVTSILGGLIMVPEFGFIGAVYAILIMDFVSLVITQVFLFKYNIRTEVINFLKPFFIFVFLILVYYLVSFENIFIKIVLLIIYFTLCWICIKDFRRVISLTITYIQRLKWQTKSI